MESEDLFEGRPKYLYEGVRITLICQIIALRDEVTKQGFGFDSLVADMSSGRYTKEIKDLENKHSFYEDLMEVSANGNSWDCQVDCFNNFTEEED